MHHQSNTTTKRMDLKKGYELLQENDSRLANVFKHVYESFAKQSSDDLKTYLDMVINETTEWFKALPTKYKSNSSLSRPKLSIIKLFEHQDVIKEYGEDYCKQGISLVKKVWKTEMKSLVQDRQEDNQTTTTTTESDIEEMNDSQNDTVEVDVNTLVERHLQLQKDYDNLKNRFALTKEFISTYMKSKGGETEEYINIMLKLF